MYLRIMFPIRNPITSRKDSYRYFVERAALARRLWLFI